MYLSNQACSWFRELKASIYFACVGAEFLWSTVRSQEMWLLFLYDLLYLEEITSLACAAVSHCSPLRATRGWGTDYNIIQTPFRWDFFPLKDESFLWNRFQNRKMEATLLDSLSVRWFKCTLKTFMTPSPTPKKYLVPAFYKDFFAGQWG